MLYVFVLIYSEYLGRTNFSPQCLILIWMEKEEEEMSKNVVSTIKINVIQLI